MTDKDELRQSQKKKWAPYCRLGCVKYSRTFTGAVTACILPWAIRYAVAAILSSVIRYITVWRPPHTLTINICPLLRSTSCWRRLGLQEGGQKRWWYDMRNVGIFKFDEHRLYFNAIYQRLNKSHRWYWGRIGRGRVWLWVASESI